MKIAQIFYHFKAFLLLELRYSYPYKYSLIEAKTEIQNSTLNDRTETLPKKIIISKKATHKHRKKNAGVRKDKNKRYSPKRLKKKKIYNTNSKRIENSSALSRDKYRQWDNEAHINSKNLDF